MSDAMSGYAAARFLQAVKDQGDARVDLIVARRRAEEAKTQAQRLAEVEDWNASNLAEKHALRAALERFDPKHPLLVDASLRERIHKAGITAVEITSEWDAASEAGRTFKY